MLLILILIVISLKLGKVDWLISNEEMDDSLPTNIEVFKALKIVRKYAQFNTLNNEVNSLSNIEKSVTISIINSEKQSMITNFFK